jgi:hypothetical protein
MAASQITPVDYAGFKTALQILMKGDPRFKDFDFEGSGLVSIIRLLSTVSSSQGVSSHFTLAESHYSTSEILENVQALVTAATGYVPMGYRSSKLTADIVITPTDTGTAPATLTIPKSFSTMGVSDGTSYTFYPLAATDVNLVNDVYTATVELIEGTLVTSTFTKSGSAPEIFEIPNKDIDISTMQVFVRASSTDTTTEEYTKFESAFQLGVAEKLYYLSMNRRGFYQVEFGDDAISAALADGNIIYVQAMTNSGASGNGVSSLVATAEIGGYSDITVTVQSASAGGEDPEDIETIQKHSEVAYGMDGVAVATAEYGEKLRTYFGGRKITQWGGEENLPYAKPGYVILCVSPALTVEEKTLGNEYLSKYCVGSILTEIVDPGEFDILLDVFVGSTSTLSSTKNTLKQNVTIAIQNYAETKTDFALEFEPGDLEDYIKTNVSNVDRVYIGYRMAVDPTVSRKTAYFDFHREFEVGSFSVDVTGLTNYDQFKDDGTGVIQAYLNGVYVEDVQATVNYTAGTINITGIVFDDATFSMAYATAGGDDLQIQTMRNEIMNITIETLTIG